MSATAIKISSTLANLARTAAAAEDRSVAGQIEHWASIGKAIASALPGATVTSIKNGELSSTEMAAEVTSALRILEEFRSKSNREPIKAAIGVGKRILYAADEDNPDGIVQVLPDGTRRKGRFSNRQFIPAESFDEK